MQRACGELRLHILNGNKLNGMRTTLLVSKSHGLAYNVIVIHWHHANRPLIRYYMRTIWLNVFKELWLASKGKCSLHCLKLECHNWSIKHLQHNNIFIVPGIRLSMQQMLRRWRKKKRILKLHFHSRLHLILLDYLPHEIGCAANWNRGCHFCLIFKRFWVRISVWALLLESAPCACGILQVKKKKKKMHARLTEDSKLLIGVNVTECSHGDHSDSPGRSPSLSQSQLEWSPAQLWP